MCGIAGSVTTEAFACNPSDVIRMSDQMAARGPDGKGLWASVDGRAVLAHRRLAIIDLTNDAAQPMVSADGRWVVTFNGEIYNYRELRASLIGEGAVFQSASDTEVLLHMYARHQEGMLPLLRGMFAFAIYDVVEGSLFLARDGLGIKPLYFAELAREFRFASQVKALLAGGRIATAPSPAGHCGFYLWGHVPEPFTLYRGIRSLRPGHWMRVKDGRITCKRWFSVTNILEEAEADPSRLPAAEAQDAFRSIFRDTIAHHLVADVPVGAFLSAGMDSSAVVGMATELGQKPRTFTLGFDEFKNTEADEVPIAELVARSLGTEHVTRRISQREFRENVERIVADMDQPSIDGVNTWLVCKAAREAGLKVALSGLGGDEILGGYPSFQQVPQSVRTLGWMRKMSWFGTAFRRSTTALTSVLGIPKYAGLFEYGFSYERAYLLRRALHMPWELSDLLDPVTAREGLDALRTESALAETCGRLRSSHLRIAALETSWYMSNQLLRDADWASMAHGLELRVPLVDVEFIRQTAKLLAGSCPPGKKSLLGSLKTFPVKSLLTRPKSGFQVPVATWLNPFRPVRKGLRPWACRVITHLSPHKPRLRVAMIYRQPGLDRYSIEQVFRTISGELADDDVELIGYYCGSRWKVLKDMIRIRRLKVDLFHITGDVHYFAILLPRGRTILTIHDLRSWSERLTGVRRWAFWLLWIYLPVRVAAKVVAVSEFTRQQILRAVDVPDDKLVVIGNAVAPVFVATHRPFNAQCPTVLQIGTSDNKNMERVIEAIAGLPVHLSIVGRVTERQQRLLSNRIVRYSVRTDLSTEEVAGCYAESDIVCFASLFEGYGMPIIEAQAVGRPVITSNMEPMSSVAGGAALVVDPTSVGELRTAIQELLTSESLRTELVSKGLRLSSTRSAKQIATLYRQLYQELHCQRK